MLETITSSTVNPAVPVDAGGQEGAKNAPQAVAAAVADRAAGKAREVPAVLVGSGDPSAQVVRSKAKCCKPRR